MHTFYNLIAFITSAIMLLNAGLNLKMIDYNIMY